MAVFAVLKTRISVTQQDSRKTPSPQALKAVEPSFQTLRYWIYGTYGVQNHAGFDLSQGGSRSMPLGCLYGNVPNMSDREDEWSPTGAKVITSGIL